MGGPFERALLFKILADRIPLACTLTMDEHENRIVYNQVALPIYDEMVLKLILNFVRNKLQFNLLRQRNAANWPS